MSDLIDRQEAIDYVLNLIKVNKYYHPHSKAKTFPIDEVVESLKICPSVDAVPVKHGHWKISKDNYFNKCSECGALYDIALTENIFTSYCPRCGAKMDGERKDDEQID